MGIFDTNPVASQQVPTTTTNTGIFGGATPFDTEAFNSQPASYAGIRADDIRSNPESMQTIRDYLTRRKGVHINDYSDEEVYDAFVNHMRSFNVNEVTTGGELLWVRRASDEDKQLANEAYGIFDSLGSVFTNDGLAGAADGVGDYVRSLATAPSTWLGGIIGKVATAPARVAVKNAASQVVTAAVRNRATAAVGDVATQAAVTAAEQQARNMAVQAARQAAAREVAIAIGVDATVATGQDAMYQATMMNVGAQDKYSALQTLINTATGLVGGIPSAISHIARQRDAVDISTRAAVVAQRNAEAALEKARPEIEEALKAFDGQMIDWMKAVENGDRLVGNDYDLANKAVRTLLDPDPINRASIVAAMQRAGVGIKRGDPENGAVAQIASFARNISPERKADLDALFKKHLNGMSFDEFTDVMVSTVSQAGSNLKLAKDAADALTKVLSARKLADDTVVGLQGQALRNAIEKVTDKPSADITRYVQSVWRRALVSHPATTAVNVAGWAQVEAFKGLAEILHGGVLGTVGLAAKLLSPVSAKVGKWADAALLDSKALMSSQIFKLRTLLSPSSTRDIFDAVMQEANPRMSKKLKDSLYGGIEGTSEAYNIPATNKAVKVTEGLLDRAGKISMLKLQDTYTKSMSFVTELDKQLRLMSNTTLNDVLKTGDLSLIPDDVFQKAVDSTLKSTMSFDYGRSRSALGRMASFVETVSNLPIIGFIFPFGRFMNNQLGFIMEYTPLGILPELGRMRQKGLFTNPDLMEAASKALVGSAAFTMLLSYDAENQKEGHAWYEVVDQTGRVINVQNMAPISSYMAAARYWNGIRQGQITPELQDELIAQLGSLSMMSTVQQDPLGEIVRYVNSLSADKEGIEVFGDFLKGIAPFFTGVAAGFTRPFEPLDALVGVANNSDYAVDRRQLSGADAAIRGASRYLENIFATLDATFTGKPSAQVGPARQDASQFGPVRDPNPLSRLTGVREQMAPTNITKLFNMVNIPIWTIQERSGIPEWDALMNEVITPRLEQEARQLMNTPLFKNGNLATRERLTRAMLRHVREETLTLVERQMGADDNLLRLRQSFMRRPQSLRRQAMEDLNITGRERELSFVELQQLNNYIDLIRDQEESYIRR